MSRALNHGFEDKCSEETFNSIYNMAFARGVSRGEAVAEEKERERILEELRKIYVGHLGMENSDACVSFRAICRIVNNES